MKEKMILYQLLVLMRTFLFKQIQYIIRSLIASFLLFLLGYNTLMRIYKGLKIDLNTLENVGLKFK